MRASPVVCRWGPAPRFGRRAQKTTSVGLGQVESGRTESTAAPTPDVSGSAAAAVSPAALIVESAVAPTAPAESLAAFAAAAVVSPYAPAVVAAVSTAAPVCAAALSAFAPAACSGVACSGSDLLHPLPRIIAATIPAPTNVPVRIVPPLHES